MTPAARLHLLEYFNEIADLTKGGPDLFIARSIEQAAKLSLLHHIYFGTSKNGYKVGIGSHDSGLRGSRRRCILFRL